MATKKLVLGFFLCLLATTALATTRSPRLGGKREQCRLQRLTAAQPAQHFEYEGGSIETWDVNDDQFQCVGVAPERKTIQANSLSLPSFHPFPRLLFVEEGEGIIGVHFPGCAETFDTGLEQQQQPRGGRRQAEFDRGHQQDSHQKVHRFRKGNIIAIPAGAAHWAYNDGNREVVIVAINDINNPANQLDFQPRSFYLAGAASSQTRQQGQKRQGQQQEESFNFFNIFAGFNRELLAEAFNVDQQIITAMQESGERGLIVRVKEPMRFVTPDEQQEGQFQRQQQPRQGRGQGGESSNGLEETICSSKFIFDLDSQREADIFSRQAGKLTYVNQDKLPILSYLDLGAEKGNLQPNALFSPYWSINGHTIFYVLNGDAQVQTVSNSGEAVFNEQVNKGDFFLVPQYFANTARAGPNGFEWVAFKTNKSPMTSTIAGYTSVFRAMPLEVITNAYEISPSQAQNLKTNRGSESILFSPQRTSQRS